MNRQKLVEEIKSKRSVLCVGLDSDINKIPKQLLTEKYPLFSFNKEIIDATAEYAVSYKLNTAFYESLGPIGWEQMQMTAEYISSNHFTIADAKRGDIGNTGDQYAKAFFETMNFDAVTLSPYMGKDSIDPFLADKDKWAIILAHTSNKGAFDFQTIESKNSKLLYEEVVEKSMAWGENIMFVLGATKTEAFKKLRELSPNNFFLVPGVGAQGGDLKTVLLHAHNKDGGLLVNSSRGIIFASSGSDFAEQAGMKAFQLREEMRTELDNLGV